MLFGQSVFQSVVERLDREAENNSPVTEMPPGVRAFNSSLVFETAAHQPSSANVPLASYLGFLEDEPAVVKPEPEPKKMPPYLERTSLSDVSDELAISDRDTVETLSEKRRRFARMNHPDTTDEQFRENAALRMTAANLLIDQAIRFLGRQQAI